MNDFSDEFDDDETGELAGEVAISFETRDEDLAKHGITREAFEEALVDALEKYDELDPATAPSLSDLIVAIGDQRIRVGDVADIEMTTDLEDLDEDELDDVDFGDDEFDDDDLDDADEEEEEEDEDDGPSTPRA
jgi:hypothetical protein